MKTAIEELVEYYSELVSGIENVVIDKFLETEKQQIIEAYNTGWQYGFLANSDSPAPTKNSETYFNETYNNQ